MKRIAVILILLSILLTVIPAQATVPYYTLTMSVDGDLAATQNAYEPVRSMVRFGQNTFKTPSDLFLATDGNLYIADTGNRRILVVTKQGDYVKTIGSKDTLRSPKGVFVDSGLNVYVADEKNGVVVFSPDGELLRSYGRPDHPMYGDTAYYKPAKIAVDENGTMYIVSAGNTNGIIKLTAAGKFLGYFGTNKTRVSAVTRLRKLLYTDQQFLENYNTIVPISVENVCIDEKGLVYAVSKSSGTQSVRRLNVAGNNNLTPQYVIEQASSVAVTPLGSILVANAAGDIMELTSDGSLLFLIKASMVSDIRMGLFKSVAGIAVDEDYAIYVLDSSMGSITVLRPTEFTNMVHRAFESFQEGFYEESKALWTEVKRMNSLFAYASMGLGEALYREDDYEGAMEAFQNAGDKEGYSDAWWEVRADWLHDYAIYPFVLVVAFVLLILVFKAVHRRTGFLQPALNVCARVGRWTLPSQLAYAFYILRNPSDHSYGIKRQNKGSYLSATILLLGVFVCYVMEKYYSGFLFKTIKDGVYELVLDAEVFVLVFGLVVVCFYLVSTVQDGEARFKDLYIGFANSLIPYLIFTPIAVALSNVLTYNESFFIAMIHTISYGWTGLLLVLTLMFLNNYSLKKTVSVIIWALFTIVVVVAVGFILIVLTNQLINFLMSVYGEAVYRYVN